MKLKLTFLLLLFFYATANANLPMYSSRGVGGGGALSSYSISPYSNLRFVGTDMGTLYRSTDKGKTWQPINQKQISYNSDLTLSSDVGFSADPNIVFFADAGKNPKRSTDGGITWSKIPIPLIEDERILYWLGDSLHPKSLFCGTTEGLLKTNDSGLNWKRVKGVNGNSKGTTFIHEGKSNFIYHANETEIFISKDQGESFQSWYIIPGSKIRGFTGGSDQNGSTLAFIDSDGERACAWVKSAQDSNAEQKSSTVSECGYIWVQNDSSLPHLNAPHFKQIRKEAGRFIRMAENDSKTIYVTGGNWVRQYGSKIWVSKNAGASWSLVFQVYNWDQHPYQPWPREKLEYSAVGLDIGWDDNVPFSFSINQRNSAEIGSAGHYFLHLSKDYGEHWLAPFTQYADEGERTKGKRWKSNGLEVTSNLRLKFHPHSKKIGYASLADLGGLVTEDGGNSFRISKAKYNTNYDYAFDPEKQDRVFAASGSRHDFPLNINTPIKAEGGIFESNDRGRNWKRLTPDSEMFNRQFLSVAYDPIHKILYGGTQGSGIAKSKDQGKHWEWINTGFPNDEKVIPQLEIDPKDGSVFALLTGNAPEFKNNEETGIYILRPGRTKWEILRQNVRRPSGVSDDVPLWQFPSAFAIDFTDSKRNTYYLTDIENKGAWLASGVWKTTDHGKSWARVTQFTHPTSISIDPNNSKRIFVSGLHDLSEKWGQGGFLYSNDGGHSFKKSEKLPLLANLFSFTLDPSNPKNGFFLFFGGGIYYGPTSPQ